MISLDRRAPSSVDESAPLAGQEVEPAWFQELALAAAHRSIPNEDVWMCDSQSANRHRYGPPPQGPPPGLLLPYKLGMQRAHPNREPRGSTKAKITRSFWPVMEDMYARLICTIPVDVFPGALTQEPAQGRYSQQLNWLLSDFQKKKKHSDAASGANPQDWPSGAASGANPQDLPRGAASGANQPQQKHWLARRVDESHMLQKIFECMLDPCLGGQFSAVFEEWAPSLQKCMEKMPDVKYFGFVEVDDSEFARTFSNSKGRLLKDMFEVHDGELAVIARDVTTDAVQTPKLPWLMDSQICYFPKFRG